MDFFLTKNLITFASIVDLRLQLHDMVYFSMEFM